MKNGIRLIPKYYFLITLLSILLSQSSSLIAQLPLLNNYQFNSSSYNVAYIGANQSGEFFANYRKQWLSMPNSPWYMQATMGVPIRNDKKLAIGFNILHQQAFVLSNTSALANIAYHLSLGKEEDKHYLSGGMGFGMQLQSLNLQNATPYTMDDPNYTNSVNSGAQINFSLGLLYRNKGFELGFAIPQSFGTTVETYNAQNNSIAYKNNANLLFNTAYNISMGKDFYLKPQAIMQYTNHSPVQFLGNITLNYKNNYFFGAGVRSGTDVAISAFNATFGIQLNRSMRVAYSYEQATKRNNSLGATHDIMVGMQWGKQMDDLNEQLAMSNEQLKMNSDQMEADKQYYNRKIDSLNQLITHLNTQISRLKSNSDSTTQELTEQQLLMEQTQSEIDLLHLKLKEDKRLDVASYQLQNAVKMGAVYFGMGKSAIGTDAEAQILNVLDRVKAMPKAMHIYIVGSNSKEGNDRLNLMLATQRAIGVRDLIMKHGIGKNKVSILPINADNIIPMVKEGNEAAKRRVEIWLLEEK